jgi:hypothetical protein
MLRRRSTPPLIGFVRLSEFLQQLRCCAYRVSANPLCRYPLTSRRKSGSTLGFPRSHLPPKRNVGRNPLPGLGSLAEFHPYITASEIPNFGVPLAPSEVLCPSAFCQPHRATFLRWVPPHPVVLRPQGFSPSRRFAPYAACWACSIPVPLLGFALRGLIPRTAPYVLSDAGTLTAFAPFENRLGPQGLAHATRSFPWTWGLARLPRRIPPWAFPCEVSRHSRL